MSDEQIKSDMQEEIKLLFNWSKLIAMLPLEEWRQAFEHAEALGPILNPTLFIQYLHSPNGEIIKDVIDAAIPLKRAILKAQHKLPVPDGMSRSDGTR